MDIKKKNPKIKYLLVLPIFAFLLFSIFGVYSIVAVPTIQDSSANPLSYNSNVCVYVTRADGTREDLGCDHNQVYNSGLNATRDSLAYGVNHTFNAIVLCNSTQGSSVYGNCGTPSEAQSEGFNTYTNCGLSEANGTVANNGAGNYSVWNTFTASAGCGTITTNVTKLKDRAGTEINLSGNTFTIVSLTNPDTITVNWTVWIE
jgi:hypothetical protein